MSALPPSAWRAWGADPCTRNVVETMRAAVKLRRQQSNARVAAGNMLEAAEAEAEAKAIEDLVRAIDALTGGGDGVCRACGAALQPPESGLADCCPCNSPRGVNHGIIPADCCTCDACDPAHTGSSRRRAPAEARS